MIYLDTDTLRLVWLCAHYENDKWSTTVPATPPLLPLSLLHCKQKGVTWGEGNRLASFLVSASPRKHEYYEQEWGKGAACNSALTIGARTCGITSKRINCKCNTSTSRGTSRCSDLCVNRLDLAPFKIKADKNMGVSHSLSLSLSETGEPLMRELNHCR